LFGQAPSAPEEGVYTSAQAEQGKKLYATRCAACHGADLGGQSAPPLAGPQFERSWISTTTLGQGWLTAVDASSGKVRWRYRSPRPIVAAVTTTAGNVVFSGELTGDFIVLDAQSGDVLYRFDTGGPIGGGIVTYEINGKQYVGVMSGRPSGFWIDRNPGAPTVFLFALP